MIYLVLSLAFLAVACLVAVVAITRLSAHRRRALVRRWMLPLVVTGVALVILTAVFDNVMIALGFMVYSDANVTGLSIGLAPVEDFSYPLAGLILLPALWLLLGLGRSDDAHG